MSSEQTSKQTTKAYTKETLDLLELGRLAHTKLGVKPFNWQLDAAACVLCGEDLILDVGTGCGKTLVFQLPLLLDHQDIALIVSPLTALMIEQAKSSKLSSVALCAETVEELGYQEVYKDVAEGKYQQVLVSPELVISSQFRRDVLSHDSFTSKLRVVCIDEAHCINVWGGSFRSDYESLGLLRGRLPRNIPFLVASATFPDHVLDDVRRTLQLSERAKKVAVTNDRPNVALSVRIMKHSEKSKGDLRFLIPPNVSLSGDEIPITAVYCNTTTAAEDVCDALRSWARDAGVEYADLTIVFYHAKVGSARKREIEEKLARGEIRIICCTDAVGMGCDLRNIQRVVLWTLPETFSALVQRAGRAVRNMSQDGEAILIITKAMYEKDEDMLSADIEATAVEALDDQPNVSVDDSTQLETNPEFVEVNNELVSVREGARVSKEVSEDSTTKKPSKRQRTKANFNSREAQYLVRFIKGKVCRRRVWNEFFRNETKLQLVYPTVTTFQSRSSLRCCDVCTPELFPVPEIDLEKVPGLRKGRKLQQVPEELKAELKRVLYRWRDTKLLTLHYGEGAESITSLSGGTILTNDVIQKIVDCGVRLTEENFKKHVRWAMVERYGPHLITELAETYKEFDEAQAALASEKEKAQEKEVNEREEQQQQAETASVQPQGRVTRSSTRAQAPSVTEQTRGRGRGQGQASRARARARARGKGRGRG